MANTQLLELIVIAMVAAIILFRLYTVLGRRTGHERPPQDRLRLSRHPDAPQNVTDDNVVTLPAPKRADAPADKPADPVARGLLDIKLADRGFETEHFLAGARSAYEMILTAFAAGDRPTLKPLLGEEVYKAFDGAIAAREQAGEKVAFAFVGFKDVKIAQAQLQGRTAEITVAFGAQFISGTGAQSEGKSPRDVTDVWTFSRDTRARDPNWTLVATSGDLP